MTLTNFNCIDNERNVRMFIQSHSTFFRPVYNKVEKHAFFHYTRQNKHMHMIKKYPEIAPSAELKIAPSNVSLNAILNYSKSIEVKKTRKNNASLLIHLN